jgi:hypothetical protein
MPAVVAADRHLQKRFEGWIVATPDRWKFAVLCELLPTFQGTCVQKRQALLLPDILVVVFGTQVSWNVSISSQETTWISCFVPVLQVARPGVDLAERPWLKARSALM